MATSMKPHFGLMCPRMLWQRHNGKRASAFSLRMLNYKNVLQCSFPPIVGGVHTLIILKLLAA